MSDDLCLKTLRFLAVDAIEKARSGHPGLPLGAAPMAYVLWDRFLRHSPHNPLWSNRDRFLLSAGHGSALLYGLLHLTGYDLSLEELRSFRQWETRTPGHPEYGRTPGVEATTGPLGQGFAMGVGMALAERFLAATFNRPGFDIVDHYTYALVSDGDLMEGISAEAASIAGHQRLGKLIYLYDDNHISIEGDTALSFTEDIPARFRACGWHVISVADGNDLDAIDDAIGIARVEKDRPSLIVVRTHIGYGSPKQDSADSHGAPLGPEATLATRQNMGWPEETFHIPEEALTWMRQAVPRGQKREKEWNELFERYAQEYPELAAQYNQWISGELPEGWDEGLPRFQPEEDGPLATRAASGQTLQVLAKKLTNLLGGSADLGPSNKTILLGEEDMSPATPQGRNVRFGIREHAMGAIVNGMALHGGILPYGATFLMFVDYFRPAIRMAGLMQTGSLFVFSHDSIAVGEDGPTHQPVEQVMQLRDIFGLTLYRPADANETVAAWRAIIERKEPACLILTRQKVPVLDVDPRLIARGVSLGGYILAQEPSDPPQLILVATGSEVGLALQAKRQLDEQKISTRLVSLPSWELLSEQSEDYRQRLLPPGVPRLVMEAGLSRGWREFVGEPAHVIGIDRFGISAPCEVVMEKFGFRLDNVLESALQLLQR